MNSNELIERRQQIEEFRSLLQDLTEELGKSF